MAGQNGFLDGETAAVCFAGAMASWTQRDPAAALSFAEKHPSLLGPALRQWASGQPDDALEWLRAKPGLQKTPTRKEGTEPDFEDPVEQGLSSYVRDHPGDSARFADAFHNREDFYASQAQGMARKPAQEVAAWIKTLPEDDRAAACTVFTESLRTFDVAAAASICAALPELWDNAPFVFTQWAESDPIAASKFMQSGDVPGAARDQALPVAVQSWLVRDRAAAMEFIRSQPPSEVMGRIMLQASAILTEGDSESARNVAMTFPDISQRIGACRYILETGFNANSGDAGNTDSAAAKWIDGIPDAEVRRALTAPAP